jgi:hypothetical protein
MKRFEALRDKQAAVNDRRQVNEQQQGKRNGWGGSRIQTRKRIFSSSDVSV